MAYRFETASGLRLYACDKRLRMGETSSIQFLDPFEHTDFDKIELLFETKTLAKSCRLNNKWLHSAFLRQNIVPKSLFIHGVEDDIPNTHILKWQDAEKILSSPWMVL